MTVEWFENLETEGYETPFIIEKDYEYRNQLKNKLDSFVDDISMLYIKKENLEYDADMFQLYIEPKLINDIKMYASELVKSVDEYYKGNIGKSQEIVNNLIYDFNEDDIVAISNISNSVSFKGIEAYLENEKVEFYRARCSDEVIDFKSNEMLHIPFNMRSRVKSERFSIPGLPCLYLGNSSYVCWLEMGRPAEHTFNVSPVLLDNNYKIFNLTFNIWDFTQLKGFHKNMYYNSKNEGLLTNIKLLMLSMATSFKVLEEDRSFKSEYIIPQMIMLACKKRGLNGVTYYSKQVENDSFGDEVIVNLALFAEYSEGVKISNIFSNIKIDDSYNLSMFKNINNLNIESSYKLRIDKYDQRKMIGTYKRNNKYKETIFYKFDKFLFYDWKRRGGLK